MAKRKRGRPAAEIAGQRFGKLTVIRRIPRPEGKKNMSSWWLCICDCGVEARCPVNDLRSGNNTSCGCAARVRNDDQSVYIISTPQAIKIGVTNKLKRRIGAVQTNNAYIVQGEYLTDPMPQDQAKAIEGRLHGAFADRVTEGGGEWFHVPPAEAVRHLQGIMDGVL